MPEVDDGDMLPDDYPADYMWCCTGTLLSPTLVLTAGHCVVGAELAHVYDDYDSEEIHPALTAAPPSDDFPCFGDSGGPVFLTTARAWPATTAATRTRSWPWSRTG